MCVLCAHVCMGVTVTIKEKKTRILRWSKGEYMGGAGGRKEKEEMM